MVLLDLIRVHTYILTILPDLIWQCWDIGEIGRNSSRVYVDTIQVGIDGNLVSVDGRSVRGDIVRVLFDPHRVVKGVHVDIKYILRVLSDTVRVFSYFLWIDTDVFLVLFPVKSVGRDTKVVRTDVSNVSIYLLLVWLDFIQVGRDNVSVAVDSFFVEIETNRVCADSIMVVLDRVGIWIYIYLVSWDITRVYWDGCLVISDFVSAISDVVFIFLNRGFITIDTCHISCDSFSIVFDAILSSVDLLSVFIRFIFDLFSGLLKARNYFLSTYSSLKENIYSFLLFLNFCFISLNFTAVFFKLLQYVIDWLIFALELFCLR